MCRLWRRKCIERQCRERQTNKPKESLERHGRGVWSPASWKILRWALRERADADEWRLLRHSFRSRLFWLPSFGNKKWGSFISIIFDENTGVMITDPLPSPWQQVTQIRILSKKDNKRYATELLEQCCLISKRDLLGVTPALKCTGPSSWIRLPCRPTNPLKASSRALRNATLEPKCVAPWLWMGRRLPRPPTLRRLSRSATRERKCMAPWLLMDQLRLLLRLRIVSREARGMTQWLMYACLQRLDVQKILNQCSHVLLFASCLLLLYRKKRKIFTTSSSAFRRKSSWLWFYTTCMIDSFEKIDSTSKR